MLKNTKDTTIYLLPLILIGVAVSLLCIWNAPAYESIEWPLATLDFRQNPSWQGFWEAFKLHNIYQWHYDNIRFMQTAGFLLFFLPPYVADIVAGLSVIWMLQAMASLVGVWRKDMLLYSICIAAAVFLLPWYSVQISSVWILNYSLTAAVWAYTLRRWLTPDSRLTTLGALLLGILIGWMHELYAAILFAGVIAVATLFRQYRNRISLSLIIGACIPLAIALSIPGTEYRVSTQTPTLSAMWLVHNFMILPVVVALVAIYVLPASRRKFHTPLFIAIAAGALAGIAVSIKYGYSPRTTWGQNECGILILILILKGSVFHISQWMRRTIVALLWIIVSAHYALAVAFAYSYYKIDVQADKVYNPITRDEPTIFVDYPHESRLILLATLIKYNPSFKVEYLYSRNAFPTEVASFNPDSCRIIKTNLPDATVYDCQGILVSKGDINIDPAATNICFSGQKMVQTEFLPYMFENRHGAFNILSPKLRARYVLKLDGAPIDSIYFDLSPQDHLENHWEELRNRQKLSGSF